MSDYLVIGAMAVFAVLGLGWWMEHERAESAKAWISIYAEEAAAARAETDDLQTWCDAWEERALKAEAEAKAVEKRYEALQVLYCHHVRESLAANTWIIMRKRATQ